MTNLYNIRAMAISLGRTDVQELIDSRIDVAGDVPYSKKLAPKQFAAYADFAKVAVLVLSEIYHNQLRSERQDGPQLFRGYKPVGGDIPNAEFVAFKENIEPGILSEAYR